jgi:hypothetical protein
LAAGCVNGLEKFLGFVVRIFVLFEVVCLVGGFFVGGIVDQRS